MQNSDVLGTATNRLVSKSLTSKNLFAKFSIVGKSTTKVSVMNRVSKKNLKTNLLIKKMFVLNQKAIYLHEKKMTQHCSIRLKNYEKKSEGIKIDIKVFYSKVRHRKALEINSD